MFTIEEIKELIKAFDESSLQELEYEEGKSRLQLKKDLSKRQALKNIAAEPKETVSQPSDSVREEQNDFYEVTAPTLGTFYAASEPGAAPFVQVGQMVKADSIVCILEAMKLFNEVTAGCDGEIVEICAKDGDFIEYGQPLFRVKRS